VVSSQQNAQQNVAQFADQVIAFHLVADSFMCVIFRCAFALDTLKSFSATERLLELLHFLHFGFYQNRAGDNFLVENWLLRLLRHFSGSRDPYVSVANVDVLELPRDSFSQEDVEYDRMMAIYQ